MLLSPLFPPLRTAKTLSLLWICTETTHFSRTQWEKSSCHAVICGCFTKPPYTLSSLRIWYLPDSYLPSVKCFSLVPSESLCSGQPGAAWDDVIPALSSPFPTGPACLAERCFISGGFSRHLHLVSFLGHEILFHFNFKWLKLCKNTVTSRKKLF